jgi:hypothetical protein
MAARKARVEGARAPKAAEGPSLAKQFRDLIATFRDVHPDKWDEIALTPTQHGVDAIAEHLERL